MFNSLIVDWMVERLLQGKTKPMAEFCGEYECPFQVVFFFVFQNMVCFDGS